MVLIRRHFVPNPVCFIRPHFVVRDNSPLSLHTRYDPASNVTASTSSLNSQLFGNGTDDYTLNSGNQLTSASLTGESFSYLCPCQLAA